MNSLISQFVGAWLHPWDAMSSVKQQGEDSSIAPSMIFIIVMGIISGIITAIVGMILPPPTLAGGSKAAVWLAALVVPVVSFIGSFIGAFIIWGLVDGLLRGTTAQYKIAYRLLAVLAAFSPISAILSAIPVAGQYLAIIVNIWATVVMVGGIIIIRETPFWRTIITCFVIFGFLFALGIFARVAAQREFQSGNAGFGDFGAPADDLGAASDDLEQQLQELADKAKANQKTQPEQPKK